MAKQTNITILVVGEDPTWYPFRFNACDSLRSLSVAFNEKLYIDSFKTNPYLALIPVLKYSSQTLRFLTIAFLAAESPDKVPTFLEADLPQFEEVLLSLPHLERILFVADRGRGDHLCLAESPGPVQPVQEAWLIKCFPKLESRGLLQVFSRLKIRKHAQTYSPRTLARNLRIILVNFRSSKLFYITQLDVTKLVPQLPWPK